MFIAIRSLMSGLLWLAASLSLLGLARAEPRAALVVGPLLFVGLAVANAIDVAAEVLARDLGAQAARPTVDSLPWTKEPPRDPGWYWVKVQGGSPHVEEFLDGRLGKPGNPAVRYAGPICAPEGPILEDVE